MVAFGHAAFFGAGAYTVAVLMESGSPPPVAWPAAVAVRPCWRSASASSACARGVYFIMITLAFAQMFYYLAISMKNWGGDDGLSLATRSAFGPFDLKHDPTFYWWRWPVSGCACTCSTASRTRASAACCRPSARTSRAWKGSATRCSATLLCFVIGAAMAGLAGALIANHGQLASPNLLQWTQSGTLLVMVIVGGVGALYGGAVGRSSCCWSRKCSLTTRRTGMRRSA